MDEQQAGWNFKEENDSDFSPTNSSVDEKNQHQETISWVGSEFISNQKTYTWYLGLSGFIFIICLAVYLIGKDIISIFFIIIMGVLFGIIAGRKPRQLQYSIDDEGIRVGQKTFSYAEFRSFSLQRHGAIGYVSLLPFHRFHNELSIYFPPENEQQIFEALASRIPNEQRRENPADKLAKLIRF